MPWPTQASSGAQDWAEIHAKQPPAPTLHASTSLSSPQRRALSEGQASWQVKTHAPASHTSPSPQVCDGVQAAQPSVISVQDSSWAAPRQRVAPGSSQSQAAHWPASVQLRPGAHGSEAQAKQQALLANARAEAASRLAQAMQANPQAGEALRLLLAADWMAMGEQMANAPAGSVLMVDPQSPASLLTALRGLQQGGGSQG